MFVASRCRKASESDGRIVKGKRHSADNNEKMDELLSIPVRIFVLSFLNTNGCLVASSVSVN